MSRVNTFLLSAAGILLITGLTPVRAQAPVRNPEADISQRLARIEQLLQGQGLLDMLQRLDSMQQEIKQLRGEIEVQGRDIQDLQRRQRALYTDIDQRLQGIEGKTPTTNLSELDNTASPGNPPLQTLSPVPDSPDRIGAQSADSTLNIQVLSAEPLPQQQAPANPDATPAAILGQTGQTATTSLEPATAPAIAEIDTAKMQMEYQQAFDLLKQAQYEQAIQAFRSFLEKYPSGEYSDNAQYWLGEAYYVMRQFDLALEEYKKVVANFPQSQKYTHALLKIGYCYHELGRIDDAKKILQSLISQYPGETASRLAEERLKSIALTEQQMGQTRN